MKGWFGPGKSKTRRVSLDLHYGARTSVWSEIAARAHLIVAAIGSVALLGMAGTAIWMALPSDQDNDIIARVEAAPQMASASSQAQPAQDQPATLQQDTTAGEDTKAADAVAVATTEPDLGPSRGIVMDTAPKLAEPTLAETDPEPLDATDPRWIDNAAKNAGQKAPKAERVDLAKDQETSDLANAYAEDGGDGLSDDAATAAIPIAKPVMNEAPEATAEEATQKVADAGRASRTLRSVTMRARPSDRGGVLGTVPGRADVRVVSCDHWCEIIYKGKRGFVYRRFLVNNGR